MRRKRRNHSPKFKAKIAMEALKGDKTLAELAQAYDVHPNQIQEWKKQLQQHAEDVFSKGNIQVVDTESKIKALHEKIGELTVERDFLSGKLGN